MRAIKFAVKCAVVSLFLLAMGALTALAQLTDTGSIVGTVHDQTGAAIPAAKITVTNVGTNVRQTIITDASGQYVVPSLKVGTYSLTVEKTGFQTSVQGGITVDVQSRVQVDVTMQLGSMTQRVEVTGAPPLLNTQTAELGQVVSSRKVEDLPLNGRHYSSLALLVPGVFVPTGNLTNIGGEGYFGVNGNSATQNNYVLDGIDNNTYIENFQGKAAEAGQVPVDAVAEFKLQTRTYDTEFGRSAGGVVNAQIKSGTNQLHGNAWEFVRNSSLDATDFFTNTSGGKKPAYQQNQFGGTAGAPIVKDKVFVFGAYEGFRERQGDTQIGTVPTPFMRQLNFTELKTPPSSAALAGLAGLSLPQLAGTGLTPSQCIQNATLNSACVDPTAAKIFALYPQANLNQGQNGVAGGFVGNNFIASPKRTINTDTGVVRVDQKLGEKDSFYEHYSIFDLSEYNPFIFQAVNPIADGSSDISLFDNRNQNGAVGWTHIINPTTVIDVRAGANQLRENAKQLPFGQNVNSQFGVNGVPVNPSVSGGLPEFDVSGFSQLGSSRWTPMVQKSRVYQLRGILSAIRGTHTLKFGGEWRRDRQIYLDNCCDRGAITFNGQYTDSGAAGVTDFLLGLPNFAGLTSVTFANKYQNGLNFFGQDTWRVNSKLTLNYGLRWEHVPYFISQTNAIANFNPTGTNSLGGQGVLYTATGGSSSQRSTVNTYNKAFAPRIGLAYRLQSRLVFRAGYGIFYENYSRLGNESDLALNPPFYVDHEINFGASQPPGILLQNGFPPGFVSPVDITNPNNVNQLFLRAVDPHLRPGMIQQMSGGFEYSLKPDTVLSVSWTGNYSHRMWHALDLNQKVLTNPGQPSGIVPFPNYVTIPNVPLTQTLPTPIQYLESTGNADYNAALISLERRFSKGLSFLVSYTISKNLADYQNELESSAGPSTFGRSDGPQNAYNLKAEKGLTNTDTPQRLVFSLSAVAPVGRGSNHLNSGLVGRLLEQWQVNTISTFQSGQPLEIVAGYDTSQTGLTRGEWRANCNGAPNGSFTPTVNRWFDTSVFSEPLPYTFGTCSTSPGPRTPGLANVDLSLFKSFAIGEKRSLQFRAEFFNAFNKTQFGPPDFGVTDPAFGAISSVNVPPREIQFSLKFYF